MNTDAYELCSALHPIPCVHSARVEHERPTRRFATSLGSVGDALGRLQHEGLPREMNRDWLQRT